MENLELKNTVSEIFFFQKNFKKFIAWSQPENRNDRGKSQ